MAIDTAAKRKSCIGLALIALRMGIIPSGSDLSAAERLHTDLLYSGIAASTVTTTSANIGYPGWQISVIHRNWLDCLVVLIR